MSFSFSAGKNVGHHVGNQNQRAGYDHVQDSVEHCGKMGVEESHDLSAVEKGNETGGRYTIALRVKPCAIHARCRLFPGYAPGGKCLVRRIALGFVPRRRGFDTEDTGSFGGAFRVRFDRIAQVGPGVVHDVFLSCFGWCGRIVPWINWACNKNILIGSGLAIGNGYCAWRIGYNRTMTESAPLPPARLPGQPLGIEHCTWYATAIMRGAEPGFAARMLSAPLNEVLAALARHGDEVEALVTAAARIAALRYVHEMVTIADGPAVGANGKQASDENDSHYVGDGDSTRDNTRIQIRKHLLGALTKIAPKNKIEVEHKVSIVHALEAAKKRVNMVDVSPGTEPVALPSVSQCAIDQAIDAYQQAQTIDYVEVPK